MSDIINLALENGGWLYWLLLTAYVIVGVPALMHAILSRREVRSSIAWVGLIWLTPLVGALLYVVFGVNRIQRTAARLRGDVPRLEQPHAPSETTDETIWQIHETGHGHLATLEHLISRLTGRPLHAGNTVQPLSGGDEVYPAMLDAIDAAETSISLASYIFDTDDAGRSFVEALKRADERGVEIRVLVDAVGARYSWPTIVRVLRHEGITIRRFLPSLSPTMIRFFNLRNHRKILVVDGKTGFTGGMNIRGACMASKAGTDRTDDLHFRLTGPAVADLQLAFATDWAFTTDEMLEGPAWFPEIEDAGDTLARGISDGPDDDMDHLRLTFMGALSCARRNVRILTPYFLPEPPLMDALSVCAMRGVEVDVVLPSKNNIVYMHWAMQATVDPLLERGVRIWLAPPPFDHSKLMIVDDTWCCFGSTNWDPRSLRLNFEFNVECYDRNLGAELGRMVRNRIASSELLTQQMLNDRSLPVKLRDGIMRLFQPYL